MREFVINRLREPSTWRGIIGIITATGVTLSPDEIDSIVAAGMAVSGLVAVFSRG